MHLSEEWDMPEYASDVEMALQELACCKSIRVTATGACRVDPKCHTVVYVDGKEVGAVGFYPPVGPAEAARFLAEMLEM